MADFEKLQALVKAAQAQEAERKKIARAGSEQRFESLLEATLSQQLRDILDLKYSWDQEDEQPQATFELWGPRVVTGTITSLTETSRWRASLESGELLVAEEPGGTFERALLLAIGDYWDEASRPTRGPGMLFLDED